MSSLTVLVLASGLVLAGPDTQPNTEQTRHQSLAHTSVPTRPQTPSAIKWTEVIQPFALGLAWATLVIQVLVLPFYNKGEKLHNDYFATGRINSTIAAFEAGLLIPALAKMFTVATHEQEDKRRRPESEIQQLLQRVDFIPLLESAQDAMSKIVAIDRQYEGLKQQASRVWRISLVHVVMTMFMPMTHVFLLPIHMRFQWLFWSAGAAWLVTLAISTCGFIRFHSQIAQFNNLLESPPAEER